MIESPIFLVGSERSGTTLLRLMLDHHPEVAFNLESEYLVTLISDSGKFPDPDEYSRWLARNRVFAHSRFDIAEGKDFVGQVNGFLKQLLARESKRIVGATVHFQFSKLHLVWPQAKYIYLYRDGRDVAQSVVQMGWAGNTYAGVDLWLEAEEEWQRHKTRLGEGRWIEVCYETLVSAPERELARICEFMGVAFSERMFDYVGKTRYGRPDPRLCGKWKRGMGKRELQFVEARIGDGLVRRGYPLSGHSPVPVGALGDKLLRLHSRAMTYRHRLKTFGPALTLKETLSRRLGMKRWHEAINRRIDAIIDANLM